MKQPRSPLIFLLLVASPVAALALSVALSTSRHSRGYVAHEWGTFTSVQGGDGVLLDWQPLQSSGLPDFVYNWQKAGLNRQPTGPLVFSKGAIVALQRMETPVIYFYSDHRQNVDVSVKFPQGFITEWYPQAGQIGPSTVPLASMLKIWQTETGKLRQSL